MNETNGKALEALQALQSLVDNCASLVPEADPRDRRTVSEILNWYEMNHNKKASREALKERLRQYRRFRKSYGHLFVRACRPTHLLEFIANQPGAKADNTKRRIKATICRPFNYATEAGLIGGNPFRSLRMPEGRRGRDWTRQEYAAVLRHSHPYFRRLIVFLRFAGARPGEARMLQWSNVQDEFQTIVLRQHKTSYKTDEPRRIFFNHVILRLLVWLLANTEQPGDHVFGTGRATGDYVFLNGHGRPWTIKALTKHFRTVCDRAGLPKDVKCHGGRHTFSTNALMNGVDIATLAQLLGHSDVKSTQRYIHLVNKQEHLNGAMNRAIGKGVGQ